jgi:amino acid transporter
MVNVHSHDDDEGLKQLGYSQVLRRSLGGFNTFVVSFALMSVTTGIVLTYSSGLGSTGPRFVIWWPIVAFGTFFIALTFANLGARIPVTGYAYQWTSRLVNNDVGWFVGWIALVGWLAGTASIAYGTSAWVLSLLGISQTTPHVAAGATLIVLTYVIFNVAGIKVLSWISRIASPIEVLSSVVLSIILVFVWIFAKHHNSISILTSNGNSGAFTLGGFSIAALTSLWTIQTFEAASEFAEETVDVRRVMPRTIIRTWATGVFTGALLLLGLTLVLPNISDTLGADVPVLYIVEHALGNAIGPVAWAVILIAVYSCGVATMGAATRLTFSMARDNTLPFSKALREIHPRLGSPVTASIVIGVLASAICYSAKALQVLSGVAALAWYVVYLAATLAALWAYRTKRLARFETGEPAFDLGRWATPSALISLVWVLIAMALLTFPKSERVNAEYTGIALAIGLVWYVVRLRVLIARGEAGAPVAGRVATAADTARRQPEPSTDTAPGLAAVEEDTL